MHTRNRLRWLAAGASLIAASAAQAHPGHGVDGLAAGLAHPFLGADHLLSMLVVGLWSAAAFEGRARLRGPIVFIAMLLAGAGLAWAGVVLPGREAGVALSVVLLAALMLGARRLPAAAGLALVAGAALLHGQAHGVEWHGGAGMVAYAAGFAASSAVLHATGLGMSGWLRGMHAAAWRLTAALIGAGGLAMLATRL